MNLNPEQQQAVDHVDGPCIVTAVPGSGKTRTLTARVVSLIKHGASPSNILCLTFTNKAANEMRERVAAEVGGLADSIWISTFHSFFLAVLRKYGGEIGLSPGFSVYGDGDQRELIEKLARMHEYETNRWGISSIMKAANDFREDIVSFETVARELRPVEAEIIKEYLETVKKFNAVDFSGILAETYRLFQKKPKAAEVLAKRFQYILVDEWQDTNTIQYETLKLIAQHHNNLFVVGDPQQCVHEDEQLPILKNGVLTNIRAGDLPSSGKILSYRNQKVLSQKFDSEPSLATSGYKIFLSSGATLSVSSDHRIYTTGLMDIASGRYFVYLMYRPDLGFRVGVTCRHHYGDRQRHEGATKLWILKVFNSKDDALSEEQRISLEFGVPTAVFNGDCRGISQTRLNSLFGEFGPNGYRVLEKFGQDFLWPIWRAQSIDNGNTVRRVIYLNAHAAKGSQVILEWTGDDINAVVESCGTNVCAAKRTASKRSRWRIRKFFNRYSDAREFAHLLSDKTGIPVVERLSVEGHFLILTRASSLCVDCHLPILDQAKNSLILDRVVAIEPLCGNFVSVEVSDSSVFFNTDGVLSHNSIFEWRGAKPENINRVREDFENVKEITLPRNYRSTKQILAHAERLIRHNEDARTVKLISEVGDGDPVRFWTFALPEHEGAAIAGAIVDLVDKYHYRWKDCAILYRMNALSKVPEVELRKLGIPYKIYGGFSFFDRREIKQVMAYLKFVANSKDSHAFTKAIKVPARGVGDTTVGRLERYCQTEGVDMLTACSNCMGIKMPPKARTGLQEFKQIVEKYQKKDREGAPLPEIAEGLLKDSGYYEFMKQQSKQDQDWQKRIDNINEMLVDISEYASQKPKARLGDYLQSMELITSDDSEETEDAVSLLTMHSAKGLEFPVVFVIGVERDIIPHKAALYERGENEERRLMYVASTRAKRLLFLSHCQLRHKWKEGTKSVYPSPFLYEMNPEFSGD